MDIVILANFCGDFSEKDNGRFLYLAKLLAENHNVELITSDFFHIKKTHRDSFLPGSLLPSRWRRRSMPAKTMSAL